MRSWLVLFLSCSFLFTGAQVFPYQDLFFWSQENMQQNKITQLDGYEFDYVEDSIIVDSNITLGIHQTEEYFDTIGRVIQKINHYSYSDVGYKKRVIHYGEDGHVKSYFHYSKESLERAEIYEWKNGRLENWRISAVTPEGLKNFVKEIIRDSKGQEIFQLLKKGRKILSKDSINFYVDNGSKIRTRKNIATKEVLDSIVDYKTIGDTIIKKEIYEKGVLIYRELVWNKNDERTQRIEEYQNNEFYKVHYRRSIDGLVHFEKQIHLIPNLNFEKKYYYTDSGIPIKKELYRNEAVPVSVVYYITK